MNGDVESMNRLLIHLTWVLLVTASCTGGNSNSPNDGSPSSRPLWQGGTLRVVIPLVSGVSPLSEGPALDPQTDYWYDSWALFRCCLLRTLLAHPGLPTEKGGAELHTDLATEMPEISDDGLTWTFRLKEGIAYAPPLQQTQVVAADIIRALEREAALASPDTYAFYYSVIEGFEAMVRGEVDSISGLEAPDDSTLIVHLTRPAGDLANLFAMPATAPIPPNPSDPSSTLGVAEGLDHYGRFLVATGPYMIEGSEHLDLSVAPKDRAPISGYVPGRSLTLVRNPSWEPEFDALRPSYVDRIEFTIGVAVGDLARMVRSGQADLYIYHGPSPQIPIDVVQRFLDDPGLADQVHLEPRDLVRYITINVAVPPLDDIHVRRAMSYAIDKQALLDLRGGPIVGDVARHIVLDSLENGLLASYDPYPTSLAKARAEMARSSYDQDGDGRCDHEACRGLLMLSTRQIFPEMGELAASVRWDLRRIGVELRIETVPSTRGYDALQDPRAKVPLAIFTAWGKDTINASQFVQPLFSSDSIGSGNFALLGATSAQLREWGYHVTSVPSIDDKIDECGALVGDVQFRCWAEADQLLVENVIPWVPYVFENTVHLVSDRVVAYSFDQFSSEPALERIAVSTDAA
jgi:peptide/nickel transport system substrate-binding protein